MKRRMVSFGPQVGLLLACLLLTLATMPAASAAPRIDKLSLRGLQAGGVTTLVVEGSELLPEPRLLVSAPQARYTIKDGATPQRLEVEFVVDPACPSGIYLLRAASATGVSEPMALGIDNLAQIPFVAELPTTNVALSGALSGSTVLSTKFNGKAGQKLVIEVESARLGSNLKPTLHLYDARHTQLAGSRGLVSIADDARLIATLPADGSYSVELHDALFRGADPGFFRLKIGDFHFADLAFPLGAQSGVETAFEFASTNLPAAAPAKAALVPADGLSGELQPAPWPVLPMLSGSRPVVRVSQHAEVVEAPPGDKPQELPAAPVAINGRIGQPGEQDRYRIPVTPKSQLRIDVLARRAGSLLDGVLSIQNEQGAELASADDRPGSSDPQLDFNVPDGVTAVFVTLRDLSRHGGADYLYRIEILPPAGPSFQLALDDMRLLIPKDGVALARVRADRAGYNGPIKLNFPNLPASVSVTGDEIPAGASQALVTLSAPGLSPAQSLTTVLGSNAEGSEPIKRRVALRESPMTRQQPWLASDVAVAVTSPAPIALVWDLFETDARLALGTALATNVRVERAAGVTGAVRLSLLTTQPMPRKKVKANNQEREVDDEDRALRFEAAPTIAADQAQAAGKIMVPGDLPAIAYDLAIQAELLGADNKSVVAAVVSPARRMTTRQPIALELASASVEARAGVGPTGNVKGTVRRVGGFASPVNVSVVGLPKGASAPAITLKGDQSDFEFPLALPYGTPVGELKGVKVTATCLTDPKNPKSLLRTPEANLAVVVVPGEKPAMEKPLAVFEDQPEFVANLTEGGGQASLIGEEKYSGTSSVKVTPDQRFNPALPGLGLKIREKPGPGEFRYLRFAWKKQGGSAICLQLNHDGLWGPSEGNAGKFRYHAGPGECFGASLAVDAAPPAEFVVVTRDLFADFGEFTLNGLALSPVDGEYGLFDHIYLGTTPEDFELVKP